MDGWTDQSTNQRTTILLELLRAAKKVLKITTLVETSIRTQCRSRFNAKNCESDNNAFVDEVSSGSYQNING